MSVDIPARGAQDPSSAPLFLPCPERTLMLPLTEGSLRLRADDEDSLTSEDSFFSATEVMRVGGMASGRGEGQGGPCRLCWGPAMGRGKVKAFPLAGAGSGGRQVFLPRGLFNWDREAWESRS